VSIVSIIVQVLAVIGLISIVVQILFFSFTNKLHYATLNSNEEEEIEGYIRMIMQNIHWGRQSKDTTVLILAIPTHLESKQILNKLKEDYPELELFVSSKEL